MKLFVVSLLVVAAVADRLDNTYLPPGNARTAGGSGSFLNAPFGGASRNFGGQRPSAQYGAPGFGSRGAPSSQYGAPGAPSSQFGASGFGSRGAPSSQYGAPGIDLRGGSSQFGASGSRGAPSSQYGAPGSGAPSSQYGAPSGSGYRGDGSGNYAGGSGNFAGGRFGGQSRDAGAAILRYNNENYGDGTYRFEYETENGISQNEAGELKDPDTSSVRGSYSYTGDDGQTYTVNYIADENGFQPFGEHIAQISQSVQTTLQRNAAEAQQGYQYQGSRNNQGGNRYQGGGGNYQTPNRPSFNQQTGYQY